MLAVKGYILDMKELNRPLGDMYALVPRDLAYRRCAKALTYLLEHVSINEGVLKQKEYPVYTVMLQALRMKYYALFRLIACQIRAQIDKGVLDLSDSGSFQLCLVGGGSQGVRLCEINDPGFLNKIRKMFAEILGVQNNEHFLLKITKPVADNNEEVVVGLTFVADDQGEALNIDDATADRTMEHNDDMDWNVDAPVQQNAADPAVDLSAYSVADLYEAYLELLRWLYDFEGDSELYSGTVPVDHLLVRVDPRCNASARDHFNCVFSVLNSGSYRRMLNPTPETYKEAFALAMLESMIDRFI